MAIGLAACSTHRASWGWPVNCRSTRPPKPRLATTPPGRPGRGSGPRTEIVGSPGNGELGDRSTARRVGDPGVAQESHPPRNNLHAPLQAGDCNGDTDFDQYAPCRSPIARPRTEGPAGGTWRTKTPRCGLRYGMRLKASGSNGSMDPGSVFESDWRAISRSISRSRASSSAAEGTSGIPAGGGEETG